MAGCHHECELYTGRLPEAAESEHNWKTCQKNPGHENFLSVPDFEKNYLPRIRSVRERALLRAWIDLTVRLRVRYTSLDRPDGGDFTDFRGTDKMRVGTGFIREVNEVDNKRYPCFRCAGEIKSKHWEFTVQTSYHVVFNKEEAKNTVVDIFYDGTDSDLDGSMKSVRGLVVLRSIPERDVCGILCVTCDESLGERIKSAYNFSYKAITPPINVHLKNLGLPQSSHKYGQPVLIVSHPHGQPKQITLGYLEKRSKNHTLRQYNTHTCPGSSGAAVILYGTAWQSSLNYFGILNIVHSGSFDETSKERKDRQRLLQKVFNKLRGQKKPLQQLNYGFDSYNT